ncbi:MAG: 1-(5-phosphoribosyl)-5-[(5-phosphoribosylamino)methylideneamino] imidazole-4-carboxamide isomerase [Actinomycetota bacterium]|nr:1-(5-phosphoribosyl)-5-[(5-phosphoribosylamino)methylideneamino] imidazole-4-carboxamide isomerase [Actinomycetota bacterium]
MEFIPAIDLIEGKCVRLIQGDFDRQISYGNPVSTAQEMESQGAAWLHLVDLDAARSRNGPNRDVIKRICQSVNLSLEVGGGVRSFEDARELFDAGVTRVILGTMAIEDPGLVQRLAENYPGKVVVGLDYRRNSGRREVALKGWLEGSGRDLFEVLPSLVACGASAVVATDISRDGTFKGPDIETLDELLVFAAGSGIEVIASGGVSNTGDLLDLRALSHEGVSLFGVISGRAIHDGRLDVGEAVRLCRM